MTKLEKITAIAADLKSAALAYQAADKAYQEARLAFDAFANARLDELGTTFDALEDAGEWHKIEEIELAADKAAGLDPTEIARFVARRKVADLWADFFVASGAMGRIKGDRLVYRLSAGFDCDAAINLALLFEG